MVWCLQKSARTDSGATRPKSRRPPPSLGHFDKCCWISALAGLFAATFGACSAKFGLGLVNLGSSRRSVGSRPKLAYSERWFANFGQDRPNSANFGPKPTDFYRVWPKRGQNSADLARLGQKSASCRPPAFREATRLEGELSNMARWTRSLRGCAGQPHENPQTPHRKPKFEPLPCSGKPRVYPPSIANAQEAARCRWHTA